VIAIDTSALMAVVLNEPEAERCSAELETAAGIAISAGTMAEALIVAAMRKVGPEMARLIDDLGFEIVPVTAAVAQRVARAYEQWGKGVHPAGLNFGDCFAYALAQERGCPLLYVGDDFSRADMVSAITAP
jgi:ribonuclease VapC